MRTGNFLPIILLLAFTFLKTKQALILHNFPDLFNLLSNFLKNVPDCDIAKRILYDLSLNDAHIFSGPSIRISLYLIHIDKVINGLSHHFAKDSVFLIQPLTSIKSEHELRTTQLTRRTASQKSSLYEPQPHVRLQG